MMEHQFRENGNHYNGGSVFFGYGYQAIGEPRLSMVRKWFRTGERRGQTEDSFSVDGSQVESYAAALEALKSPPLLTDEEAQALRAMGKAPVRASTIALDARWTLRGKGFIACTDGACSVTDAGLAALDQPAPPVSRSGRGEEVDA